ncbi:hypothetical protein [Shewanella sp. SNU WT4]|uniref:hypothetical protein n=1 Tax=Shewanella sp. SNU WT4 TaxID=2590015 RepID=UPI001F0F7C4A|nr:hypothetical protein [Shewanella sp. SNU WT4]
MPRKGMFNHTLKCKFSAPKHKPLVVGGAAFMRQAAFMVLAVIVLVAMAALASSTAYAGKVVVHDATEPFDAFAVRNALREEKQWQQTLAFERQLKILQDLPINCVLVAPRRPEPRASSHNSANRDYQCGQQFYRPYQYQGKELYIGIPAPEVTAP